MERSGIWSRVKKLCYAFKLRTCTRQNRAGAFSTLLNVPRLNHSTVCNYDIMGILGAPAFERHRRRCTLFEPMDHRSSSESSFPRAGVRKLSTTKSATWRPRCWPEVRSERKCTPAKMRLKVASSAAAEKLLKER